MKINFTNLTFLLLASICFISCKKTVEVIPEKTISAKDISIIGPGKEYIKVLDGDYKLKVENDKIYIPVKFELIQKYDGKNPKMGNLGLSPLDKSNVAVRDVGYSFSPATMSDWSKVEDLLASDVGATNTISFEWDYFSDREKMAKIMKETNNFEITNTEIKDDLVRKNEQLIRESNRNDEVEEEPKKEVASTSKSSDKVDEALDSYEDYVDQYIKFLKKAQNGDNSAMAEYPSLMQKATDMQEKIDGMKDDFSPKQMSRMMKIVNKMNTAAMEMQ